MLSPSDGITFNVDFKEPGDYKIILEYNCPIESSKQEGLLEVGDQHYYFETLGTGNYDAWRPLMFIQQSVAMVSIAEVGVKQLKIAPVNKGKELFKLSRVIIEPVK
jgi:alpha-L-fucosidase